MSTFAEFGSTHRVIKCNSHRPSTKFPTIEFLDSSVGILTVQVLKDSGKQYNGGESRKGVDDSPLTRDITINISKRDTASVAAKILQVLRIVMTD